MLQDSQPLLSLAALLGFEPVTRLKVVGITLTGVGVVPAVGGSGEPEVGATLRGDLLMFATSCCGAIYFRSVAAFPQAPSRDAGHLDVDDRRNFPALWSKLTFR